MSTKSIVLRLKLTEQLRMWFSLSSNLVVSTLGAIFCFFAGGKSEHSNDEEIGSAIAVSILYYYQLVFIILHTIKIICKTVK